MVPLFIVADPEELCNFIQIVFIFLSLAAHRVLQLHTGVGSPHFFDAPALAAFHPGIQLPPGDMVIIRVDGHMGKCGVVPLVAGFNGRADRGSLASVQRRLMEILYIIQALGQVLISRRGDPGVIENVLPSLQMQDNLKYALLRQPGQIQRLRLSRLADGLFLQDLLPVQRIHFIIHTADPVVMGLDIHFHSPRSHRRDGIPDRRNVHLPRHRKKRSADKWQPPYPQSYCHFHCW